MNNENQQSVFPDLGELADGDDGREEREHARGRLEGEDLPLREDEDERREIERERHDPQERHARDVGRDELGDAEEHARGRERERDPHEPIEPALTR